MLLRDRRGAIALTVSQMFLGAVSLGIGMFRGTDVNAAFHSENQVAHADYGASKLAADHARSANVVVNNNVVMASIMGPRFGVEADNITLDANLPLTCPSCPHGALCKLCTQNKANKPRAEAKLQWVRAQQKTLWGTLGKLSGKIDNLASQQAQGLVKGDVAKSDSKVNLRFDDPAQKGEIWGGGNAGTACKLASKDVLPTQVTGHAFPTLVDKNLLDGLPKTLEQAMPQMICQLSSLAMSKGGSSDGPKLDQLKEVTDKTTADCDELEKSMKASVADATGSRPTFSSDVAKYAQCSTAAKKGGLTEGGVGAWYQTSSGKTVSCVFDRKKCDDDKLEDNSEEFLRDKLGLPEQITNAASLASSLGGSETRKPSQGGASPKNFCACTFADKPVDETMVNISDAVRKISSFGQSEPSEALRKKRDYRSCGKWYFPDRKGQFASTPQDETPFVAAWKWQQTSSCPGGGS